MRLLPILMLAVATLLAASCASSGNTVYVVRDSQGEKKYITFDQDMNAESIARNECGEMIECGTPARVRYIRVDSTKALESITVDDRSVEIMQVFTDVHESSWFGSVGVWIGHDGLTIINSLVDIVRIPLTIIAAASGGTWRYP